MKRSLTIMKELTKILLVGETEAGSAEVQPARDSQLGCRRNVLAVVSQMRDCRVSQDISEISLMPKKTSLPKARILLTVKRICPIYAEPIQCHKQHDIQPLPDEHPNVLCVDGTRTKVR